MPLRGSPFVLETLVLLAWLDGNGKEGGYVRALQDKSKSGREDLNLRPLGPEPSALAKLSYAPSLFLLIS